jgi:hypothetical protein
MKPSITLKSFNELSAEQLVIVPMLPATAPDGPRADAAASTPRCRLPIRWNETAKSMTVVLQVTMARTASFRIVGITGV